ncbi:LysR family transcriptional regulator [Cohnella thailandensis]|uniref:LysR family transcriptional regulator n=1 Tax=Cohnella thailandensis TaxID=557557 RepID=A0A841T115_9BACL|nr:LysR family transcriptional regulator [Cohnella thailandensis]MBB6637864.1 LysR family transcriptional regulator [Cohnella thailandensis]MBP1977428.1 DNA-binding transcriptional LysR family regulator [Cohnella thailandensis]
MDLTTLKSFMEVARCQSFTKAAENLGYVQSSVTTHIQKLEQEYGVILFERYGRIMRLTSAGEYLHHIFAQILTLYDDSKLLISRQVNGNLNIGTIESMFAYFLPPVFMQFRQAFPQVCLNVQALHEQEILQMIRSGEIDTGIILDRMVVDDDIESIPIREEPLVLFTEPSHPLCGNAKITMSDMNGQSYVATEQTCTYRNAFERLLESNSVCYRIQHEFESLEAIKQFVGYGLGVGLLPRIAIERELAEGRLVALPFEHPEIVFHTQIVLHRKKWKNPAIRHLIELLENAATIEKRLAL